MKIISFVFTITLIASTVHAGISDNEYAKCSAIKGDLARLECFDNLSKSKNLNGLQTQNTDLQNTGKWKVKVATNPIDDTKSVTLSLVADSGHKNTRRPIVLIARCKSGNTDLYISWSEYLGRDAEVLTRVGTHKAITSPWSMSTDKKATFAPKPEVLLKEILDSNKFIAQITPYNESPRTAIFDTTGLENAIHPLKETCGW